MPWDSHVIANNIKSPFLFTLTKGFLRTSYSINEWPYLSIIHIHQTTGMANSWWHHWSQFRPFFSIKHETFAQSNSSAKVFIILSVGVLIVGNIVFVWGFLLVSMFETFFLSNFFPALSFSLLACLSVCN